MLQVIRDEPAGYRGEENAVAEVARGEDEAFQVRGAQYGFAVLRHGTQPRPGLYDRRFRQSGRHAQPLPDHIGHAARGHAGVEPGLLHRGAHQHASVPAGYKVLFRAVDDAAQRRDAAPVDADHLAPYGLDRRRRARDPLQQAGPGAGRDHHAFRSDAFAGDDDTGRPVPPHDQVDDRVPDAEYPASGPDGGDQGLDQPPVLHLVHLFKEQAAP